MRNPIEKVVWAIDAFEEPDDKVWKNCIKVIRGLTRTGRLQIFPVHVAIPASSSYHYFTAADLHNDALTALREKVDHLNLPGPVKPKVIVGQDYTTTGDVKALNKYAKDEVHADLILIGSHGRSGVSRFFIGSFAESLLLHSELPLIIVGGATKFVGSFNHILFPTDFSESAEIAFDHVLPLSRQFGARITIMHVVNQASTSPILIMTAKKRHELQAALKQEKDTMRAHAEKLAAVAKSHGVKADVLIRTSKAPISETVRSTAKALEVSLIAMAAHSGMLSATFAGSTARQVIRSASCPVWLFHERGFAKGRKRRAA